MNKIKNADQILLEALKNLSALTGIRTSVLGFEKHTNNTVVDAQITLNRLGVKHPLNVEIKGELRDGNVIKLLEQFGKNRDKWLLVARYIPQPIKESLKKSGINYLEAAGNCYINLPDTFIYITDQKVTPFREKESIKLWNTPGLKFLLAIIDHPTLLQSSYREIAKAANIALGSIGPLLEELKSEGYIQEKNGKTLFLQKMKLINRWTEVYNALLKPKLIKGKFNFLPGTKRETNIEGIYWGGEVGAELLNAPITPENMTIYTDKSGNDLVKILRIVPNNEGRITVLEKFWGDLQEKKHPGQVTTIAPALLIYADLYNDLDSRNRQIAEIIKASYLDEK
jgi:hypothetical protein